MHGCRISGGVQLGELHQTRLKSVFAEAEKINGRRAASPPAPASRQASAGFDSSCTATFPQRHPPPSSAAACGAPHTLAVPAFPTPQAASAQRAARYPPASHAVKRPHSPGLPLALLRQLRRVCTAAVIRSVGRLSTHNFQVKDVQQRIKVGGHSIFAICKMGSLCNTLAILSCRVRTFFRANLPNAPHTRRISASFSTHS